MTDCRRNCVLLLVLAMVMLAGAARLGAIVPPERLPALAEKEFRHPDLDIANEFLSIDRLDSALAARARQEVASLRVPEANARFDFRSGRWATLLPAEPLIPGDGAGNDLSWAEAPADDAAIAEAAWNAFESYLQRHASALRIDLAELTRPGRVTVHAGGDLVQIYAQRVIGGVPVRDSYVNAVLNSGNLVLLGTTNWGDVEAVTQPRLSSDAALSAARDHLVPLEADGVWRKPHLVLVPMAAGPFDPDGAVGTGYSHRLVWVVSPRVKGDLGSWEALVDARSGELLAFTDTNHYATTRTVVGGVYPVSNDGVPPDGVSQPGWPMPFADLTDASGTRFTDAGGNLLACVDGTITTHLDGRYMLMNDDCGPINESTAGDVLDLGTSGGIDCTVPPGHSPGDTHASRSGFYEMNRIKEQARAQLPANTWLEEQLLANMNLPSTCNAFWNGVSVNFYRSGGGCSNTGELAGVFDHEWGHGMDDNDATPGISSPGEGIPDIYAGLRLDTSCIGRNFTPGSNCGGYGDPCLNCTGVRDIDWAAHASGTPHTFTWANTNPQCGSSHCRGYVYSESVWDLYKRDLPAPPFNMDNNTALEVSTRLTYIGAGGVGTWYGGAPPFGGCGPTSGYLNYLAADDDNGNLNDGTPHMSALFDAYNRHEIACNTPAVTNSGCVGAPTTAPIVSATALDRGASLSWGAVGGASKYRIYRGEGVFQCDFGKTLVGETTGTSFIDDGMLNGRAYYYTVAAIGPDDTCIGPASSCTPVTPAAGPNLAVDASSAALNIFTGDGDEFLDNCEEANFTFDIFNIGTGNQTNVRIVDVVPVSHPSITVTSPLPITLADPLSVCDVGQAYVYFQADGLSPNEEVEFRVDVTSDQLFPAVKSETLRLTAATEGDFQTFASKTYTFEADIEGWEVLQGTFTRSNAGGGANGTTWYRASSDNLPDQCDQVRSPILRLQPTSTLSLYNSFDIEPEFNPGVWYDRANVGIVDAAGVRTPIDPDGGRLYNASGANGTCGTTGQDGWADSMPAWAESTWSSGAMMAGPFAGELITLQINYGTDPLEHGFGFHFDEVTVTNFDQQVADTQSDICLAPVLIFTDGFESGDVSAWTNHVP